MNLYACGVLYFFDLLPLRQLDGNSFFNDQTIRPELWTAFILCTPSNADFVNVAVRHKLPTHPGKIGKAQTYLPQL